MKDELHTPCGKKKQHQPVPAFPPLPPVPDFIDRKIDDFLERITQCAESMNGLADKLSESVSTLEGLETQLGSINDKITSIESEITDYINS